MLNRLSGGNDQELFLIQIAFDALTEYSLMFGIS